MTVEVNGTIERDTISGVGPYPFSFRIFNEDEIAVLADPGDSDTILLVRDTHYTVEGVNDTSGGTVTLLTGAATTYDGMTIDIRSNTALYQPTSIRNQGGFLPTIHEDAFDRLARQIQDIARKLRGAVRYPDDSIEDAAAPKVISRKGRYLFANAVTGAFEWATSVIGTALSQSIFDQFLQDSEPYAITSVEQLAGVIPANLLFAPGDSRRYSSLTDWAAVARGHELVMVGDYTIAAALTFPTGQHIKIRGHRRPLCTVSANGVRAFQCSGALSFDMEGMRFKGNGSATVPSTTFDGFQANSTGIVTVTNSQDVRIANCAAEDFYSGFSVLNCERAWIDDNHVTDWLLYAVVASRTNDLHIHGNTLEGCEQVGAVGAYGISATGDEAGGDAQRSASICFNKIRDIPSWDAIMTHDFDDLTVQSNECINVRNGLDIGFAISANAVRNVRLLDNYIEATAVDTWGGVAAIHNAILFTGFDATHRASDATISRNTCKNFYTMAGSPTFAGSAAVIAIVHGDRIKTVDNHVIACGAVGSPAGVYYSGTCDQPSVCDNTLQGEFISGAVRFANVIAGAAVIAGNSIKQVDTVNDPAIQITGSTITGLELNSNPTNAANGFVQSTSTITHTGAYLIGAFTGTLTGCTTSPTGSIDWTVEGGVVVLDIPGITATSNTTAATVTGMPAEIRPAATRTAIGIAVDNGGGVISRFQVGSDGTITLQNVLGVFTGSGTKGTAACSIQYRR